MDTRLHKHNAIIYTKKKKSKEKKKEKKAQSKN